MLLLLLCELNTTRDRQLCSLVWRCWRSALVLCLEDRPCVNEVHAEVSRNIYVEHQTIDQLDQTVIHYWLVLHGRVMDRSEFLRGRLLSRRLYAWRYFRAMSSLHCLRYDCSILVNGRIFHKTLKDLLSDLRTRVFDCIVS